MAQLVGMPLPYLKTFIAIDETSRCRSCKSQTSGNSVDLAYDALINEVDAGKMRVFLSDVMFDQERAADWRRVPIPFGKGECTVFRKVMSTEDTI